MDFSIFIILFIILFGLYFFLKKFNLLVDNVNFSEHKKIGIFNKSPIVLGGLYLTLITIFFTSDTYFFLKVICVLLLFLGYLSDRNFLLSPFLRFTLQIVIILAFVFFDGIFINTISIDFFDNLLKLRFFNIFFTLFCLTILMNGSNFLDGLNGLVTGYFILVLGSIVFLNLNSNLIIFHHLEITNLILISLLIFFTLNIFGKIYLGDSGSYIISTIVGYILIKESQNNISISPYYIVVLLWYPAFENLFSIIRRLAKQNNISLADKLHLHQLIYRYLKLKKIFKEKTLNTAASFIILLANLPLFIFATYNYSHTNTLVLIVLLYVIFYLLIYFYLMSLFRKIL